MNSVTWECFSRTPSETFPRKRLEAAIKAASAHVGTVPEDSSRKVPEGIANPLFRGTVSAPLPSPIMERLLTVKEASQIIGKSPSSIRRVIYPIIHDDAHPDRSHVQPSVAEVRQLRMKGENFAWRLSEELLRREIPDEGAGDRRADAGNERAPSQIDPELLSMLRRELDIKNQQISQQSELIAKQIELVNGLSERLREGNILAASLQQRLALVDGHSAAVYPADKSDRDDERSSRKDRGSPPSNARGFRRIFSRLSRPHS
jgi:hypothetical protein